MTITEIKTKHADKKFIKVDEFKRDAYASVKSLENLMLTDDVFLYTDVKLEEYEATKLIMDYMIDAAKDKLRESILYTRNDISAIDTVADEYEEEFAKICEVKSARFLHIRSVKHDIEYSEEEVPVSDDKRGSIVNWLIRKKNKIRESQELEAEKSYNEIVNFIKEKQSEYIVLTSQSQKDKFTKNLRFKLEDKFTNYDLSRFSQPYILYLLEE